MSDVVFMPRIGSVSVVFMPRIGRFKCCVYAWKTPPDHTSLWMDPWWDPPQEAPGSLCRASDTLEHLQACGVRQERLLRRESAGPASLLAVVQEGIAGVEGERISTPLAVAYFRSGQAVLIFFNSRRHSLRKF